MSANAIAWDAEISPAAPPSPRAPRRPDLFRLLLRVALAPRPSARSGRRPGRLASLVGADLAITSGLSLGLALLGLRVRPRPKLFRRRQQWLIPLSVLAAIVAANGAGTACTLRPRGRTVTARHAIGLSMLRATRDWLPIAVLGLVYEHLDQFTREGKDEPLDRVLHAWDLRLFGCEPTLAVSRWHHPVLTDLLAIVYFTYFMQPAGVALLLIARRRRWALRQLVASTVAVMYSGFLLYCLLPAGPPRFFLDYPKPIPSAFGWARHIDASLDGMNTLIRRSSFPSLHCALATVGMLGAWEFRNEMSPAWLLPAMVTPLTLLLYFSTIYLRHHWGVDVLFGIALGAGGYHAGRRLSAGGPRVSRLLPAHSAGSTVRLLVDSAHSDGAHSRQ